MRKRLAVGRLLLISFILFTAIAFAQQPEYKLFLVGDAGENEMAGETLDSLKSKLLNNSQSAVIFLGDNSYKEKLGDRIPSFKGFDSSRITQLHLKSQLDILNGYKGSAYFVPGNHDWWNESDFKKGKRKLKMEESFIEANLRKNNSIANPDSTFLPKNGTPGPVSVELDNKKVRIVFIDTYWLISLGFRKVPAENIPQEKQFYHDLDSVLAYATAKKQTVIVVAHHPVYTTGAVRSKPVKHPYLFMRIKQNFKEFPSYKSMSGQINAILQKYPGVYYASGHVHALQYHFLNNIHYIVSGSGSKTNHIKGAAASSPCNMNDCELWNEKGFFEVDFYQGKQTVILYHESGRKSCNLSEPGGCN
ncbi:MAG: metallophosphoesterase family protein [Bacteroidia bacterium]